MEINDENFTKRGGYIIKCVFTCLLLTGIVLNDLHNFKVNNKWILVGTVAGVIASIWCYGIFGIWKFAVGYMAPIIILYLFFILKMFGAGDIKTLAVIGGLYGVKFVVSCMLYSLFAGGVLCILSMLRSNNLSSIFFRCRYRFSQFIQYVSCCCITKKIGVYNVEEAKESGGVIHFTIAILFGFLITLYRSY